MGIDLSTTIDALKDNGFEFIESYRNGEEGYWGFNKDRSVEVVIKINNMPDEEDIETFEEQNERNVDLSRVEGELTDCHNCGKADCPSCRIS